MPLEGEMKHRLERALAVVDDHGGRGTRLIEDAHRLCSRVKTWAAGGWITPATPNLAALEIACYALQLPLKGAKVLAGVRSGNGRPARPTLKDRAEQAAEMLVGLLADLGHVALLEEAAQLLIAVHQRTPATESSRLLADALNLEDFGVSGLIAQAVSTARQGGGVLTVSDGCEKREQYGYWDARLKDGFHFDASRQIARKRLEQARKVAALLLTELREDGAL